jgi:hypothetical protein
MEIKIGQITMSAPLEKYFIKSLFKPSGRVSPIESMLSPSKPKPTNNKKVPSGLSSYFKGFKKQMDKAIKMS